MKRNLHTLQCARVLGRPNLRTLQCARSLGYEPGSKWLVSVLVLRFSAPGWPRPRKWLQMASFNNGFEDFRPLAGPGPKSGSKWLVSILVLRIFGPWLAQAQKVVPDG